MSDTATGTPAGGSSTDTQAAVASALQNGQGDTQVEVTQPAPVQKNNQTEDEGLANPFLAKIPAEHRSIIEPYIKEWDQGVQKKFQGLHDELSPYQELGDHETLAQAHQLMQMIDDDPAKVVELLQQAIGENNPQGAEEQQQTSGEDPMASLPPEFQQKFQQMEQVLELLAGNHLTEQESKQHQQQDQELDETLSSLKEKFGDFDEDYVLAKMSVGTDPEKAVEAYMAAVQGQVNKRSATPNVPAILGGGGAAPTGAPDITKASSKDVKNMIANILSGQART